MVFTLYRRLLLSSEINLCLLNIQNSEYKFEVFDNILFIFRISNTLQLHIFLILKFFTYGYFHVEKAEIEEENRSLR